MSKLSNVVAICTGRAKLTPPLVDLARKTFRLPVVGQKAKTWPAELVLMSLPIAVPTVSVPLTLSGVFQPEAVRRFTNAGSPSCQMT